MTTITRSAGIAVPGTGFVAGGGMTGATQELDAAIQAAAEALRRQYPRDVSIRFNSYQTASPAEHGSLHTPWTRSERIRRLGYAPGTIR